MHTTAKASRMPMETRYASTSSGKTAAMSAAPTPVKTVATCGVLKRAWQRLTKQRGEYDRGHAGDDPHLEQGGQPGELRMRIECDRHRRVRVELGIRQHAGEHGRHRDI